MNTSNKTRSTYPRICAGLCLLALALGACDDRPAANHDQARSTSSGDCIDVDEASEAQILEILANPQTTSARLLQIANSHHLLSHPVAEGLVNHPNRSDELFHILADGLHVDDVRIYVEDPTTTPSDQRRHLIGQWTSPSGKQYIVDSKGDLHDTNPVEPHKPWWRKVLDYLAIAGMLSGGEAPEGEGFPEFEPIEDFWGAEDGPAEGPGEEAPSGGEETPGGGEGGEPPTFGDHDAQALASDRASAQEVPETPKPDKYGESRQEEPFIRMVNREDVSTESFDVDGQSYEFESQSDGGYHWRSSYRLQQNGEYEFEINVMKRAKANENTGNPGNRFDTTSKVSTRDVFTTDVIDGMQEAAEANGDGENFDVNKYFPKDIGHTTVNNEPTAKLLLDSGLDIGAELRIGPDATGPEGQLYQDMLDTSGTNVRVTNSLVQHLNSILGTRFEISEVVLRGFDDQGLGGTIDIFLRIKP